MAKTIVPDSTAQRRQLVDQVASSVYLSRSSRLREMFMYVCTRVLDHSADEIHEQEVGQEVFGRPADYDTAADNTVRVHASMLRKRVSQYFENEGSAETVVIEIPRGNYAPVFRERSMKPVEPEPLTLAAAAPAAPTFQAPPRPTWVLAFPWLLSAILAVACIALWVRPHNPVARAAALPAPAPVVDTIWSQIFPKGKQTDMVLGDAALAILQERIDKPVSLTEYFDRSYLNGAEDRTATARLDPAFAKQLLLKRQVNYGDVSLLARLNDMAHAVQGDTKVRFARDYSFRELKADNAILFGTSSSNPWIEPFDKRLTIKWRLDAAKGTYYPYDNTASAAENDKFRAAAAPDGSHEGFVAISLVPNLNGTGNILILTGTGGTAMTAALDFLADPKSVGQLHAMLAPGAAPNKPLPYFEALVRTGSRNSLPRDSSIVIARPVKQ